jgi:hypothetical protein
VNEKRIVNRPIIKTFNPIRTKVKTLIHLPVLRNKLLIHKVSGKAHLIAKRACSIILENIVHSTTLSRQYLGEIFVVIETEEVEYAVAPFTGTSLSIGGLI